MSFSKKLSNFFSKYVFNSKWTCNICGKEIFDEEYFCKECLDNLPFNNGCICEHCGRSTIQPETYCLTCKDKLTAIDKGRSVFKYEGEIPRLIKNLKYHGCKYIAELFAQYLSNVYFKEYFNADGLIYIPMTPKAERKRGFNQSELLAEHLSNIINVPVIDCVSKLHETKRQAKLNREERLKNLVNVFHVFDRKSVRDKVLVVIDDVTTTGSTAQALAEKLKRAGAGKVYLITVASVSFYGK